MGQGRGIVRPGRRLVLAAVVSLPPAAVPAIGSAVPPPVHRIDPAAFVVQASPAQAGRPSSRIMVTGRLTFAKNTPGACLFSPGPGRGSVVRLDVRAGGSPVVARSVRMESDCRFRATLRLPGRPGARLLRLRAEFLGSRIVLPAASRVVMIRLG
jgi:hypothetical protein